MIIYLIMLCKNLLNKIAIFIKKMFYTKCDDTVSIIEREYIMTTNFSTVGFAPVEQPKRPKGGTPPINPENNPSPLLRDNVADALKDKAPVLANILSVPVGCDTPQQGGISGTIGNKLPKPPTVCYMA